MDEGTRARNREFVRRMDAVGERERKWSGVMERECTERDEEHEYVLRQIKGKLDSAVNEVYDKIDKDFSIFHTEHIPVEEERMNAQEKDFDHFVNVTVPLAIDECSGIIARKVEREREKFEIENTKVLKREEKIVQGFERHAGSALQGFEDENATRVSKLRLLTEEIDAPERIDERLEERQLTHMMAEIVTVRKMVAAEEEERAEEDGMVLDEMLRTQEKLQKSVLENFGAGGGDQEWED